MLSDDPELVVYKPVAYRCASQPARIATYSLKESVARHCQAHGKKQLVRNIDKVLPQGMATRRFNSAFIAVSLMRFILAAESTVNDGYSLSESVAPTSRGFANSGSTMTIETVPQQLADAVRSLLLSAMGKILLPNPGE